MPKLPRYDAKVGAVAEGTSKAVPKPEFLTAGLRNDYGNIIADAGNVLNRYNQEKAAIQNDIQRARLQAEATKDHYETIEMFQNDPNYASFGQKLKDRQAQLAEKYRGMVGSDALWQRMQPYIEGHFGMEAVKVAGIGRQQEVKAMTDDAVQTGKTYRDILIKEEDPILRQQHADNFNTFIESLTGRILTPEKAESIRKATLVGADLRRLEIDAQKDPNLARARLKERDTYYPSLSEDDTFKAQEAIDRVENAMERQQRAAEKELHSKMAVYVGQQFRNWKSGKNPAFEAELDNLWANNQISDGVYNTYSNRIFTMKQGYSNKMSTAKWKVYNAIEREILKDGSTIMDEDALASTRGFSDLPDAQQNALMKIIGRAVPAKRAVKNGISSLRASFKLSGFLPEEQDAKIQEYRDAVADIDDVKEIRKITKEFQTEISGNTQPIGETPAKKPTEQKKTASSGVDLNKFVK